MSLWKKLTTRNVGNMDRVLRAVPFAIFIYLAVTSTLTGLPLVVLGIATAMLLLTSVTGMCSIYAMLGLSTCKLKN